MNIADSSYSCSKSSRDRYLCGLRDPADGRSIFRWQFHRNVRVGARDVHQSLSLLANHHLLVLHQDVIHLFFNLLILVFIGAELEETWGTPRFFGSIAFARSAAA